MNKIYEKEPLFPPDSGCEKYEDALREQAAQAARLRRGWSSMTPEERHEFAELMSKWAGQQQERGHLPRVKEIGAQEKLLIDDIQSFLFLEAAADLNAGFLTRGLKHFRLGDNQPERVGGSPENQERAAPKNPGRPRRADRDTDRDR